MKILILLVILTVFSREDSMFENKMLVLDYSPQKGALKSRGQHGRIRVSSQLDVMPNCGLGRASLKQMGV